jgi:hypothetical protein
VAVVASRVEEEWSSGLVIFDTSNGGVVMLTGLPALEQTDWSRLFHAYGRATDTPDHLRAPLSKAALAPCLATDPAAIAELIKALEGAANIDSWFVELPPQFSSRPRFAAVRRLVELVTEFERLARAAEAVISITPKYCADFDWGPLLAAAFRDGSGLAITEAQRRFLGALVKKAKLWDPKYGNTYKWFKRAGLAYDRSICARQVSDS